MSEPTEPAQDPASFFFLWRRVLRSRHGPAATTRNVLDAISVWWDGVGEGAWPSIDMIMEASGASRQTVITHVDAAAAAGWVLVQSAGRSREGWRRHQYKAQIPAAALEAYLADQAEAAAARGQGDLFGRRGPSRGLPRVEGGQPPRPPQGEGGLGDGPPPGEGGQPGSEGWSTSSQRVVKEVDSISPVINPGINPDEEEGGNDRDGGADAAEEARMTDLLNDPVRDEAMAAMWAYLDGHALREMWEDDRRWRVWRAGLRGVVEGENRTAWQTADGTAVPDWTERVRLWCLAVDTYAAEVAKPARRSNEPAKPLAYFLRQWVIPSQYDPFPQRQSNAPAPGSEAAGVRSEMPSSERTKHYHAKTDLTPAGEAVSGALGRTGISVEAFAAWRGRMAEAWDALPDDERDEWERKAVQSDRQAGKSRVLLLATAHGMLGRSLGDPSPFEAAHA
ncbi:MAG: hypothetical protein JWM27_4716 [Gemmatimonadetes bacterium]|nr:hypothetical protein [Gemmatimonadota bacterium]